MHFFTIKKCTSTQLILDAPITHDFQSPIGVLNTSTLSTYLQPSSNRNLALLIVLISFTHQRSSGGFKAANGVVLVSIQHCQVISEQHQFPNPCLKQQQFTTRLPTEELLWPDDAYLKCSNGDWCTPQADLRLTQLMISSIVSSQHCVADFLN